MRLIYFAAGLLWVLLAALLFALAAVAFDGSMTSPERAIGSLVILALATPVALQLRTTHRQIREMTANRIVLSDRGIEIQLSGQAREWKGLPDVPQTLVPWPDLLSIVREKRRFVYPSVVPLGYPLDVFTIYSKIGGISFTRECIPDASRVARKIAARIGGEL